MRHSPNDHAHTSTSSVPLSLAPVVPSLLSVAVLGQRVPVPVHSVVVEELDQAALVTKAEHVVPCKRPRAMLSSGDCRPAKRAVSLCGNSVGEGDDCGTSERTAGDTGAGPSATTVAATATATTATTASLTTTNTTTTTTTTTTIATPKDKFHLLDADTQVQMLSRMLAGVSSVTLQRIARLVLPRLRRDFFTGLPVELVYAVAAHLDNPALGRCQRVSREWRRVLGGTEADAGVWKVRLAREGWLVDAGGLDPEWTRDSRRMDPRGVDPWTRDPWTREYQNDVRRDAALASARPEIIAAYQRGIDALRLGTEAPAVYSASVGSEVTPDEEIAFDVEAYTPGGAHTNTHTKHSQSHTYRDLYRQRHRIRNNWLRGRCKRIMFPGHGNNVVTCLQFDSDKIVSGSDDATINIYDTATGKVRKTLAGHDGGVWALQYHGDALVSGATDRMVRVWDMDSGRCTHRFDGHTSTVRCLSIITPLLNPRTNKMEPAFPVIVTGSRDSTIRVWKLPSPKNDHPYPPSPPSPNLDATLPPFPSTSSTSSANGAAGTGTGATNTIHSAASGPNPFFMHVLQGHTHSVRAISGLANILVSGSYDHTVKVWDIVRGRLVHNLIGHREKVYSVGYCHELNRAASGSMDATVKVWCTTTGVCLFTLEGHGSLVGLLEISPKYLVSAAADCTLRVWDPVTGQCRATLHGHNAAITCFHHDPKLNRVVSGSDGGVKAWELTSQDASGGFRSLPSTTQSTQSGAGFNFTQTPEGPQPVYGRYTRDVVTDVSGVWRVRMDDRRLVTAVQKGPENRTWFEVLDFTVEHDDDVVTVVIPDESFDRDDDDDDNDDDDVDGDDEVDDDEVDDDIDQDDDDHPDIPHTLGYTAPDGWEDEE